MMSHGRIIQTDEFDDAFKEILDDVVRQGNVMMESLQPFMRTECAGRPWNIHIIDDQTLNADASEDKSADVIRIFRGAVEHVFGTMLGLMCLPNYFPNIGNSSVEETPANIRGTGFPPMNLLRRNRQQSATVGCCVPNDHQRILYAHIMAEVALTFLVFHEIGHIVGGHLTLWRNTTGQSFIGESQTTSNSSYPHEIRRVVECDADAFACHASAFLYNNLEWAHLLHDITRPIGWTVEYFSMVTYLTAIAVLFRLLYPRAQASPSQSTLDYPHPAVRACVISGWTGARALHRHSISNDDLGVIVCDSARIVEETWIELILPEQSLTSRHLWVCEIAQGSQDLLIEYFKNRPLLEKYARLPRRWDDWEWPVIEDMPKRD